MESLEAYHRMPSGICQNRISTAQKQLGLVGCINPEVKKGMFRLPADEGERMARKLDYGEWI